MNRVYDILPLNGELPCSFAERLGIHYSSQVSETHKKKQGQFFTPVEIARFMASLCNWKKPRVKILDPGCGTAILSCAIVEALLSTNRNLSEIELVAYETDEKLILLAQQSLFYLKSWAKLQNIRLTFILLVSDFVLSNSDTLENQSQPREYFDLIISNPPYFKIQKSDYRAKAANSIVHGQPNIYSIFLYTAATLLNQDGQLIFITPRSFASGFYFRLFRDKFFSLVQLDMVHLFHSRKEMFQKDEVLQENVIISAYRAKLNGNRQKVILSFSQGIIDLSKRQTREFYLDELLDSNSYQKILYLPASDVEAKVVNLFKSWKGSLNTYNIQISTGPVVSFRAKRFIYSQTKLGLSLAPLFWLHNASQMKLTWPLNKNGKGEYIQVCDRSLPLLIPNKNYIFLRRFSSKDDTSRLIATPYFADMVEADLIGVENHLNYIYRPNGHLDRNEILGLSALLNSNLFDTYFRTFNGNINVSATELREMSLPPLETIKQIGNAIILNNNFSQSIVDEVVEQFIEREKELGLPKAQQNKISALTLLALCGIKNADAWKDAQRSSLKVTKGIMAFMNKHYKRRYAPNTRETVRRQVLHQFVQARLADYNPDNTQLPVNSPNAHYALSKPALRVIRTFGTKKWQSSVANLKAEVGELKKRYIIDRDLTLIPLKLSDGTTIHLSPGKHNQVQVAIVNQFASRFAKGSMLLYLGDTAKKDLHMDTKMLKKLGIPINQHSKLPDVLIYDSNRNWLFLIEAVTSHGPITPKRIFELEDFLVNCKVGKIYVSAFPDFAEFKRHTADLAWETEVWIMEHPDHMIHFNGDKFIGPREARG